ncbi:MAG: 2-amino-4-hydroxy-6-hydroxymethyldihydropteridine pyrophosphokinase [Firmicutes bacterium ADurb.Bin456]|nr:MAG: 2-amino-4-hydroxy-6-hydroxymethyldihydropteridine pyrophosphokinase [Firmicutes bacterium ADurb.Bin456]
MVTAYVGLGSNLGDKAGYLRRALVLLDAAPDVRVRKVAPLYRSEPLGVTGQDWYLNTVAEIETSLSPGDLLDLLLDLETKLGRVRIEPWGPRTLDLDLLLYGEEKIQTDRLTVPHPRLAGRAFVLVPLAELAPDLIIPGHGPAAALAKELAREQPVFFFAPL